jgi:hypothetical protein
MVQVVAFDEAHNTLNMLKWMRNFQNFLLEHKLLQTQSRKSALEFIVSVVKKDNVHCWLP